MLEALDYIQWPRNKRPLVPFVVFIDRNGVIRAQYTGVDEGFFDIGKNGDVEQFTNFFEGSQAFMLSQYSFAAM